MNRLVVALLLICHSLANAQGVVSLSGNEVFVTEYSSNVSIGWGDKKTWSDYAPLEIKWSREADNAELFANPVTGNNVLVDTATFHNYKLRGGDRKHGQTIQLDSTRNNRPLSTGLTWKAEHTYKSYHASWCASDDNSRIDSKFEVKSIEKYTLIVFGKEVTLDVLPVVEEGWWNRCYSGRRYTRLLISKDLDAIVSIEHVGYTPRGPVHESSYRMNVKEIKKP